MCSKDFVVVPMSPSDPCEARARGVLVHLLRLVLGQLLPWFHLGAYLVIHHKPGAAQLEGFHQFLDCTVAVRLCISLTVL